MDSRCVASGVFTFGFRFGVQTYPAFYVSVDAGPEDIRGAHCLTEAAVASEYTVRSLAANHCVRGISHCRDAESTPASCGVRRRSGKERLHAFSRRGRDAEKATAAIAHTIRADLGKRPAPRANC
jgi:hypothetical protein